MRFSCSLNSSYVILGAVLGSCGSCDGFWVNKCILVVCRWCLFGDVPVSVGECFGLLVVRVGLNVCWVLYFWDIYVYFLGWDCLRFVAPLALWRAGLLRFQVMLWMTFWNRCLAFYRYWGFYSMFLFWVPFYSWNKIKRRDYYYERVMNHWGDARRLWGQIHNPK